MNIIEPSNQYIFSNNYLEMLDIKVAHSYLFDIYNYWKQFNGFFGMHKDKKLYNKLLAIKNRHFDKLHAEHFEHFFVDKQDFLLSLKSKSYN